MSAPTERDRQVALSIVPRHRGLCDFDWHTGPNGPGCSCGADTEREAIAAALTAERDRIVARVEAVPTYALKDDDELIGYVLIPADVLDALNPDRTAP